MARAKPAPAEQYTPVIAPTQPEENPFGAFAEQVDTPEPQPVDPTIVLPDFVTATRPDPNLGMVSDTPPEGWVTDPVLEGLSPQEEARRSLQEDAALARQQAAAAKAQASAAEASKGGFPHASDDERYDGKPPADKVRFTTRAPENIYGDATESLRLAIEETPTDVEWRSRVQVAAAYRFDGAVAQAPKFVDRNWHAYDDGPALNVPGVGMVRKGQWLVAQKVLADDDTIAYSELKVYEDADFRKLYQPKRLAKSAANP